MTTPRDMLLTMLTITGYEGDKEEIIKNYYELTAAKAMSLLLRLKEEDEQKTILDDEKVSLAEKQDLRETLKKYFPAEEIDVAFKNASQMIFTQLLEDLIPTLSENQRHTLKAYLDSVAAPEKQE